MRGRSIVFHVPFPLDQKLDGASRLRPNQMLKAFRDQGFHVDVIEGNAKERSDSIREIKRKVRNGFKYEFLYSESSTMPTLLTESHHLPLYPFLDFGFLYWFNKNVAPVGLFYRDAHWKYPIYRQKIGFARAFIGYTFYWLDFVLYRFSLSHLFLPSKQMSRILPSWLSRRRISGLPPGCHLQPWTEPTFQPGKVRIFYVGGVSAPFYDIGPLLRVAQRLENKVELTICARESEWQGELNKYSKWISPNVKVVHLAEDGLAEHYANSDVFAILREPHDYLSFAVSYKVFETMSFGVPLLVFSHESSVLQHLEGWGWAVDSEDQAVQLLSRLADDKAPVLEARKTMSSVSQNHSWAARARQVASDLGRGFDG